MSRLEVRFGQRVRRGFGRSTTNKYCAFTLTTTNGLVFGGEMVGSVPGLS